MAENLILSDLTKPGKTPLNLVLDDTVALSRTESVEADVFWRFEDEPTAEPKFLGKAAAGKTLSVPFDMSQGRAVRFYLISRTAAGNLSAQNVLEAVQTVFDPNAGDPGMGSPPTNAVAIDIAPDQANITWTNHGGTGDNKIERRRGTTGGWAVVGTVSDSTDTFDDSPIVLPGLYYYRVYNEDVPGYSNEVSIYLEP